MWNLSAKIFRRYKSWKKESIFIMKRLEFLMPIYTKFQKRCPLKYPLIQGSSSLDLAWICLRHETKMNFTCIRIDIIKWTDWYKLDSKQMASEVNTCCCHQLIICSRTCGHLTKEKTELMTIWLEQERKQELEWSTANEKKKKASDIKEKEEIHSLMK